MKIEYQTMAKNNIFLKYENKLNQKIKKFYEKVNSNMNKTNCSKLYKKIHKQIKNNIRVYQIELNDDFINKINKLNEELNNLQMHQLLYANDENKLQKRQKIHELIDLIKGMKLLRLIYEKELFYNQQAFEIKNRLSKIIMHEDEKFCEYVDFLTKEKITYLHNAFTIIDSKKNENIKFSNEINNTNFYKQFLN